ncbi:MAG: hypothetical protein AAFY11_08010 [Cyanobacteria bacterium J06641_5]
MRNTIIVNTLGVFFAVAAVAPAALANEVAASSAAARRVSSNYTPSALVKAAYDGRLAGIPGFGRLQSSVTQREVVAEDLVKVAIAQGRLTAAHLEDDSFLNAVDGNLRGLRGAR